MSHTIPLTRSKTHFLSVAGVVIGAIALYNWTISPHVGYLHAMQKLEPVVEEIAEQRDRIDSSLADTRRRLQAMQRELHGLRSGLFTPAESKDLIPDLQSLIEQTGCVVVMAELARGSDRRPRASPDESGPVEVLHATVTLRGQYEQIATVLERIEGHRRKVWVDACQIDLLDPRNGQLECRLAVTVYALWNREALARE